MARPTGPLLNPHTRTHTHKRRVITAVQRERRSDVALCDGIERKRGRERGCSAFLANRAQHVASLTRTPAHAHAFSLLLASPKALPPRGERKEKRKRGAKRSSDRGRPAMRRLAVFAPQPLLRAAFPSV